MGTNNLNKKVLLLNQSYQPLMTLGAKRAIILSFTEKVEVLERYSEKVNSINFRGRITCTFIRKLMTYIQQVTYIVDGTSKDITEEVIASTPTAAKNFIQNRDGTSIQVVKNLTTIPPVS